ncbi:MAG: carboxypeptidase regulatory-like domain-containing protein [Rubrivivax sp.]|nr:carboxypeptidase regulatory-like domain-containing protein [Rubrivivax sp.]
MQSLWQRLVGVIGVLACGIVTLVGSGGGGGEDQATAPATPNETPVGAGASLIAEPKGTPLVGQAYAGKVVVVANDRRNRVTAFEVVNPTVGGAPPGIDAAGMITWTPNELDFQQTTHLRVTVRLASGPDTTLQVATDVRKERIVAQLALPASSGTLADSRGRYLVKVEPAAAGPMSGTLTIIETFAKDGSFRFSVRVPLNSNTRVQILDAPAPQRVGARPQSTQSGTTARPRKPSETRRMASDAATDMHADVGESLFGPPLSGRHGLFANVGEVNVYTTRLTPFYYTRTVGGSFSVESPEAADVFQIDASCPTASECRVPSLAPIILVHGFRPQQSVGGGSRTWGSLASKLKREGHAVFELRWITYMRFEEAAGVLAELGRRVAEVTEKKPMVLAHSFGGIVAHTALAGQGIRFDGAHWNRVAVEGVFDRLFTFGSPLSGIRHEAAGDLPVGKDDEDSTIMACEAITCFQAASDHAWDSDEISELVAKTAQIDPARIGLTGQTAGETIRNLQQGWAGGSLHAVPFTTVVSVRRLPSEYETPIAYRLGDGLISMLGQAVVPTDFSPHPTASSATLALALDEQHLGPNFVSQLEEARPSNMLIRMLNGRTYYFAVRASHNEWKDEATFRQYPIVEFPDDGKVTPFGVSEDHPLEHFIDHPSHLAASASRYSAVGPLPHADVLGRTITSAGSPRGSGRISLQIEDAITGVTVTDRVLIDTDPTTGRFVFNAGRVLADRFPNASLNVANFRVVVRTGDGEGLSRILVRQPLSLSTDLGDLALSRYDEVQPSGLWGYVIDGQTMGTGIGGADVFIMKGLDQTEDLVRQVVDTSTSRRVRTDPTGLFSVSGLEPGEYTVVVTRSGYFGQSQGAVRLLSGQAAQVTLSILRVLPSGDGAITLRWRAASGGIDVSPDLDSHFKQYFNGILNYHIYFGVPYGSATDGLDRDDTDYEGPETITFRPDAAGRYVYFVHRWSFAGTLGGSRPTVHLRIGNVEREFSLPAGETSTARYWKVFELNQGSLTPCSSNCLSDVEPQ